MNTQNSTAAERAMTAEISALSNLCYQKIQRFITKSDRTSEEKTKLLIEAERIHKALVDKYS